MIRHAARLAATAAWTSFKIIWTILLAIVLGGFRGAARSRPPTIH